jgi:hypothetical protein
MIEGKYNVNYAYTWKTPVATLPMSVVTWLDSVVEDEWGWFFIPHSNMDYNRDDWYEDQTMCLTFKSSQDLILCKLSVVLN